MANDEPEVGKELDKEQVQNEATSKKRIWTWTRAILAVSLTANLLVIGVIVGAHTRDDRDARRGPPPRNVMADLGYGPVGDALPADVRARILSGLRENGGGFAENRARIVTEVRAMLAALRQEPYDPDVLRDLLVEQQTRVADRAAQGRDLILSEIDAMSAAERAAFADRFEALLRQGARERLEGRRPQDDHP